MSIDAATVRAIDRDYAEIKLTDARQEEITIELNQLRAAIEAVRGRLDFDVDPFDFRVAMLETMAEAGK